MRAVIIGNGAINDYEHIKSRLRGGDFIICADGLRHTRAMGITPDLAIGDFDSSGRPDGLKVMQFPVKKDFTDSELALRYAAENGYDEIMLLGMTGGKRIDHLLANILMLTRFPGAYIADDTNELYILRERLSFSGMRGRTLSVIPVGGDLRGVTAKGFEWELDDFDMPFGVGLGISNVITADNCEISIKSGIGAVIINNGE